MFYEKSELNVSLQALERLTCNVLSISQSLIRP